MDNTQVDIIKKNVILRLHKRYFFFVFSSIAFHWQLGSEKQTKDFKRETRYPTRDNKKLPGGDVPSEVMITITVLCYHKNLYKFFSKLKSHQKIIVCELNTSEVGVSYENIVRCL